MWKPLSVFSQLTFKTWFQPRFMRNLVQQVEKENIVSQLLGKNNIPETILTWYQRHVFVLPESLCIVSCKALSSHVGFVSLFLLLFPSPHQPFYCWTHSVWAIQEQPSRLSTLSHLQQEVARAAACNSAQDFVWVTYIMAHWKKATLPAWFLPFFSLFLFLTTFQC